MDIQNLSWKRKINRNNNPLLPKSIRGVIIGKSGCGKTTLLCNLLLQPEWLDYNKLIVYGKSLSQPEYVNMRKAFETGLSKQDIFDMFINSNEIINVDDLLKELGSNNCNINAEFIESDVDVCDPSELDANDKNLIIFDDLMLEKQKKLAKVITLEVVIIISIYLSQNYFKLPRQTIRENANFFCLFPQDMKNLRAICH